MKKALIALGLMASISSFAQVTGNGMDVCESIRRNTAYPERVTQCVQIVSRNAIDAQVVTLLSKLASTNTVEVLNSLNAAANAVYDAGAISVCEAIRVNTAYPERVTECVRSTANAVYAPEVAALAARLASTNTIESNNILKAAPNAYFMPEAVSACEAIRVNTAYPERVTACVSTIKNKVFMNGAETFCKQMASTNTLEVNKCLATSAMDYIPAPQSRDILVTIQELRDLKKDLSKARNQIERGLTAQALQTINDAMRTVDTLQAR